MIEQAYVSGQLGKAIWCDETGRYFACEKNSVKPVECRWGDIQMLLNSGAEFKELNGDLEFVSVRDAIRFEERAHSALFLCLAGLDMTLTSHARSAAMRAAEDILKDKKIEQFVSNRLLSRPLPAGTPSKMPEVGSRLRRLAVLYNTTYQAQPAIRAISGMWDRVSPKEFGSREQASRTQQFLVDSGFMATMVEAMARKPKAINTLVTSYSSNVELERIAPQIANVLHSLRVLLLAYLTLPQIHNATSTDLKQAPRSNRFVNSYSSLTSQELVNQCVDSSRSEPWVEFVRRFHPVVATVIARVADRWGESSTALVDELIQETYLKLCADGCRLLRQFVGPPDSFYGYLKVVASRVAMDHFRSSGAREKERFGELDADLDQISQPSIEREILLRELEEVIERITDSERDKLIFRLYFQQGYTAQEIARIPEIGLSTKSVESCLQRFRIQLRNYLSQNQKYRFK
jgi:RNA polymerase sigma-70 factor (ECF subfamily)